MKKIEQISIFLENKTGRLAEITGLLAQNEISIRTLELVEAGDFGILRIIAPNPQKVKDILHEEKISAKITPVIAIEIKDKAGCFHKVIEALSKEGIDISYAYTVNSDEKGIFVIKVDSVQMEKAMQILLDIGVATVDEI